MGTEAVAGNRFTAGFYNQYYGFGDTTLTAVTAATQQPLSTQFTIPANEAQVGSAYEVLCGGFGTWGTGVLIAFTLVGQNITLVNQINGIAGAAFSNTAGFRWTLRGEIVFNATGASGSVLASLSYTLSESANPVNPGTASTNTIAVADEAGATTLDTTSSIPVVVKAGWGATTGSPTITNRYTIFRKVA